MRHEYLPTLIIGGVDLNEDRVKSGWLVLLTIGGLALGFLLVWAVVKLYVCCKGTEQYRYMRILDASESRQIDEYHDV